MRPQQQTNLLIARHPKQSPNRYSHVQRSVSRDLFCPLPHLSHVSGSAESCANNKRSVWMPAAGHNPDPASNLYYDRQSESGLFSTSRALLSLELVLWVD